MKELSKVLRPGDRHLTDEELEWLSRVPRTTASGQKNMSGDEPDKHLADCLDCRRRLELVVAANSKLASLQVAMPGIRQEFCPDENEWLKLAAGIADESVTRQMLEHAANCDHCGPMLKNALAILSEEPSADEQKVMSSLASIKSEWQTRLAGQLVVASSKAADPAVEGPSEGRPISGPSWWRLASTTRRLVSASALAAVLALAVWFGIRTAMAPDVDQLLADAYTQRRIMDCRIPGAKYAPLRVERGTTGSSVDQPQALLDANAMISRSLKVHPDDPKWLQAKARADLLEFHYDPAIQILQRALDLQPDSPELLIDLASAHYQRAEANDRPVDYGKAIEYLGRALAATPDDPVALFNRAITEEKLHLYDPAINDWQHYLRIDPTGPWAEEARQRLADVQKKLTNKQSSLSRPLLKTAQISSLIGSPRLATELNTRVEQYLHASLREWLPQAFPLISKSTESQDAQAALTALANVLRGQHDDPWLTDLLAAPHPPPFATALADLSAAVKANDSGDYAKGRISAHSAATAFLTSQNLPAALWAQAEEIYSDHLLYNGRDCMNLVHHVRSRFPQSRYPWLEAEIHLEAANCEGLVGDMGRAQTEINVGTQLAHDHQYPSLYLRGLGFQADTAGLLGDTQEDFSLASQGLNVFWASQVDVMKGYNLYTDLDTAADVLHLPNLQVSLWQQATGLIDLHPDLVQRAMAHRWLANSAYLANMPVLAAQEFTKASTLFAAAPPTEATARGKMDADIWLAGLEVRQGDLEKASNTLQLVQDALARSPSFAPQIGYFSAKSELSLQRNDSSATESALRAAIYLAEWGLRSFSSEIERRQWAQQTDSAYRNLVTWKLHQGDPTAALELWEWYRGAQYRTKETLSFKPRIALDLDVPPDPRDAPPLRTPTVVADRLPLLRDRTVIAYAVFSNGAEVWVYDDRGIFSKWLATPPAELHKRATQFIHLCSARDTDLLTLQSSARALYDLLITPIESRLLPKRTLVFELDDALSQIPMEALVDHYGQYLVQRATVLAAPSLYQTLRLHPAIPLSAQTATLVVSVPVAAGEDLPPLSDAEPEAQMVVDSFHSTHWLKGPAATLAALRTELPKALIFHFAGHAVALPEMSGLLLGVRDAHTQHSQLLNADSIGPETVSHLQLAVLSACNTARETELHNSGNEGIAQAFLRFGVPHVLASRWNVDSVQTEILMRAFYKRLIVGESIDASFHDAQLELLSQTSSAHPYYWAAFGVQGL
jgi:CHAT domain-containing protein/tetratricopeptide (TPR) repeat protein